MRDVIAEFKALRLHGMVPVTVDSLAPLPGAAGRTSSTSL